MFPRVAQSTAPVLITLQVDLRAASHSLWECSPPPPRAALSPQYPRDEWLEALASHILGPEGRRTLVLQCRV